MQTTVTSADTTTATATATSGLVVGWASGLVQVWPDEDGRIAARRMSTPLGTPEAVYELLAAVDGQDEASYRRQHAAEAGAVLALTHHCEAEILSASIEVRGEVSPSTVLALLHRADERLDRIAS